MILARGGAAGRSRRPTSTSPRPRRAGWFLLRDRPELTGDEIRNPEQQSDPTTGEPNVTFDFTDEGRTAFQEVTRRIAQRGAANARGARHHRRRAGRATSPTASRSSSTARSSRGRSSTSSRTPTGSPASTGAQISGNFTIQEAQDLAEFLRIGALPVKLQLLSQSTVSATLGQEALDGAILAGARRPGAGGPLPARLLPLPRLRRGARPVRLRTLLPGDDQADPDHADAPGHRGLDPHDRRRGRLEHRHLRADQGRGAPRALDAVRDLAGLPQGHRDDHRRERDHPDHGVHPVRARERRASRASRSPSASARSSRCSRRSCSRRRSWRSSGGRASCARPGSSAPASASVEWEFDFTGMSKYFFSAVGRDPRDRRDRVRDAAAQPRHRLRVGHAGEGGARRRTTTHRRCPRGTRRCGRIDGVDDAEITARWTSPSSART